MNAVDHNNVVIFDDRGIPSIMCRFVRPKDTEEVPAVFKIGDKVADLFTDSKRREWQYRLRRIGVHILSSIPTLQKLLH